MVKSGERIVVTESTSVQDQSQTSADESQQDSQDCTKVSPPSDIHAPEPTSPDNTDVDSEDPKNTDNHQDRDTILDASLHLFATQGVYQTSLVDISTHAQLSKARLYKHFQNKEAIADALHHDLTERLNQTLADIHENSSTSISCLRSIVEFLLDLTQQAPDVSRLLFCPKDSGLLNNKSRSESFPAFHPMLVILQAGMNSGELEKIDPKLAYSIFTGTLCSVIELHLEGELKEPLDQYIGDIWYPVWRALGKNPNRPS
ncbi:MAG TPA: TetR/AcrR family transcriptional regulator [Crenotrichaceae bacterium]|nr:TetR/AcrR family transcriptional regulator [Crenotrichaceae bacterium]